MDQIQEEYNRKNRAGTPLPVWQATRATLALKAIGTTTITTMCNSENNVKPSNKCKEVQYSSVCLDGCMDTFFFNYFQKQLLVFLFCWYPKYRLNLFCLLWATTLKKRDLERYSLPPSSLESIRSKNGIISPPLMYC